MSEESRLGREAIETGYALKQLVQAGVRVFFYLEDRQRTLDTPTDKIMLALTTFAENWNGPRRATLLEGVFGYDNVDMLAPDGVAPTSSDKSTKRKRVSSPASSGYARAALASRASPNASTESTPIATRAAAAPAGVGTVVGSCSPLSRPLPGRGHVERHAETRLVGQKETAGASRGGLDPPLVTGAPHRV
jgi:hypothetical protein